MRTRFNVRQERDRWGRTSVPRWPSWTTSARGGECACAGWRDISEGDRGRGPQYPPGHLKWRGVVEVEGEVAATGGILFHYNRPYGDIYLEVVQTR